MKTIKKENVLYPLLMADENGEVKCLFCKEKHKHGVLGGDGHRIAHCTKPLIHNPIFTPTGWLKKENGYYVEFKK